MTSMTVQEALRRASSLLAGVSLTGQLDARVLLGSVLKKDSAYLYAHLDRVLTAREEAAFMSRVRRRQVWEPVAYITGEKEFMGLTFKVSPAVLIPRPETEILVEAACAAIQEVFSSAPVHILDVGTGSGAIALSLAFYLPGARVTAVDSSPQALEVARENARHLGLSQRVCFLEGDLFPPLPPPVPYSLVVSNPPYIPAGELPSLPADVRVFEPRQALDGGPDGLSFYRRLLPLPPNLLAPEGIIAMEVGAGQAGLVHALFPANARVRIIKDYAGIDRVVLCQKGDIS